MNRIKFLSVVAVLVAIVGCSTIGLTCAKITATVQVVAQNGTSMLLAKNPQRLDKFIIAEQALAMFAEGASEPMEIENALSRSGVDPGIVAIVGACLDAYAYFVGPKLSGDVAKADCLKETVTAIRLGMKSAISGAPQSNGQADMEVVQRVLRGRGLL